MNTWALVLLLTTGGTPDFSGERPTTFAGPQFPVVIHGFTSLEACRRGARMLLRNEYLKLVAKSGPYHCIPLFAETP